MVFQRVNSNIEIEESEESELPTIIFNKQHCNVAFYGTSNRSTWNYKIKKKN